MRRRPTAAALFIALLLASPVVAEQALLEQARSTYAARADSERARVAHELYKTLAADSPDSYEVQWEAARAAYFFGTITRSNASDTEKMKIFEAAIELAKRAIALEPERAEGHFWLGVLYGVYGEARGIMKSLALVDDIKREMDACIRIDRSVEAWGPDRVLGRMYFKLPFFKGGSNARSIEHLERSLEHAPEVVLTRLYLAETLRAEGRRDEARKHLETILAGNQAPDYQAEYDWVRLQAEELLRKLR